MAALAMLTVAGCASTGQTSAPVVAAIPAEPPPPPPVNYGAFLGGTVGSRLSAADKDAALAAETGAIESGQRRSWKGAQGVYGYVEPGPATGGAPSASAAADPVADPQPLTCRSFTSTVFFAGRPQVGHGTGCRGTDGAWHLTS